MRLLGYLFVLLLLAYGAWPYYHVYALDQAIRDNDRAALARLVDLEAVKKEIKRTLVETGSDPSPTSDNPIASWLYDGLRLLGDRAVDSLVTLDWVHNVLRSKNDPSGQQRPGMIRDVSYAFFERPDRFLIRIGELGQDPVHARMQIQDWRWRITAIYD